MYLWSCLVWNFYLCFKKQRKKAVGRTESGNVAAEHASLHGNFVELVQTGSALT